MNKDHQGLVLEQFGPQAEAYLTSAAHAQGEDLRMLLDLIGENPTASLLDLGCSAGHVSFHLSPKVGNVTACDLSEEMLKVVEKEARKRGLLNISIQEARADSLPFSDAHFDFVVSRFSTHHWQYFEESLREIHRVLKLNGRAFLIDVISPEIPLLDTWLQTIELLRDPSHIRDFTLKEWCYSLNSNKFNVSYLRSFRLKLDFSAWVARIKTPPLLVEAIRALQAKSSHEISRYFAFEEDGSFTVDTVLIEAIKTHSLNTP